MLELGRGEDVLLWFPAVGDRAQSFGRTALALVSELDNRLRVVALDPPGYGSGHAPSFHDLYPWAAEELGRLSTRARHVVVAGNSSGGAIAVGAVALSAKGSGTILVCWPDWRFGRPPGADELGPRTMQDLVKLLSRSWHSPPQNTALRMQWLERLSTASHRAHVASFDPEEYSALLDQVLAPLAFVTGESDGLVPLAVVQASAAARSAKLVRLRGVAHYPHLEQPRLLARALAEIYRDFLG